MKISLFLPHVGVFGGVRRMIELGNAWMSQGHDVTLYHPQGRPPAWLPFHGEVAPLSCAGEEEAELAVCAEIHTFDVFRAHRARIHLYYCVIERDIGLKRALADADILLAANSGPLRRSVARAAHRQVLDGAGGIHLGQFRPNPMERRPAPVRLLLNGRRTRPKKGTDLVLAALRGLGSDVPPFEVVLFDALDPEDARDPRRGAKLPADARYVLNPTQEELVKLYQSAHIFVAAERKAGWCNTALEAMACGAAVVCTTSGTQDFARHEMNALVVPLRHPWFLRAAIRRVLRDEGLRERISAAAPAAAVPWSWDKLAVRLLAQLPSS